MTHENRKLAVEDELRHGAAALRAARILHEAGLWNDALSRLYYALFHHATALLLTEGIEATSHRALPGLLGQHFVRVGRLTPSEAAIVGHAWEWRTLADYERSWTADTEAASKAFAEVEPFIERLLAMLREGGWVPSPAPCPAP